MTKNTAVCSACFRQGDYVSCDAIKKGYRAQNRVKLIAGPITHGGTCDSQNQMFRSMAGLGTYVYDIPDKPDTDR